MNKKLLTFSFIGLLSFGTIAVQGMNNSHSDHSIAETNSSGNIDHEGHHTNSQNSISQAKLSVNKTIIPNKPVKLVINITDIAVFTKARYKIDVQSRITQKVKNEIILGRLSEKNRRDIRI